MGEVTEFDLPDKKTQKNEKKWPYRETEKKSTPKITGSHKKEKNGKIN